MSNHMFFMNETKYIKIQALIVHKAQKLSFIIKDECSKDHVNSIFMKVVIQAQKDHKLHFFLINQLKNIFHKITNLHGICMINPILTISIHIPNLKESNIYCMKANDSRVYMYIY